MDREYITVELVARVQGDDVVLLDSHAKKIATISRHRADKPTNGMLEDIELMQEWRLVISGMIGGAIQRKRRLSEDVWLRKCGVWSKSIRSRANRPGHCRASGDRRREAWIASHTSWDVVLDLMVAKHSRHVFKNKLRRANPWAVWADTVACNVNKRRQAFENRKKVSAESTATSWKAERTALQMRFDWNCVDARESVA